MKTILSLLICLKYCIYSLREKKYRKKIIAKKYSVDGIVPSNTISESQLRINLHSIGKWC